MPSRGARFRALASRGCGAERSARRNRRAVGEKFAKNRLQAEPLSLATECRIDARHLFSRLGQGRRQRRVTGEMLFG